MTDNEILLKILSELETLKAGQQNLVVGQQSLEAGQQSLEAGQQALEARLQALEAGQQTLEAGQQALEAGQQDIRARTQRLEVLLETEIPKSIRLIAEQHGDIIKKLDAIADYDGTKARVSTLEYGVSSHTQDIELLKEKAI